MSSSKTLLKFLFLLLLLILAPDAMSAQTQTLQTSKLERTPTKFFLSTSLGTQFMSNIAGEFMGPGPSLRLKLMGGVDLGYFLNSRFSIHIGTLYNSRGFVASTETGRDVMFVSHGIDIPIMIGSRFWTGVKEFKSKILMQGGMYLSLPFTDYLMHTRNRALIAHTEATGMTISIPSKPTYGFIFQLIGFIPILRSFEFGLGAWNTFSFNKLGKIENNPKTTGPVIWLHDPNTTTWEVGLKSLFLFSLR